MAADRMLVFARRPASGRVKTRLTPPLPPDEAAAVYEACLRDVIALAARQRARVEVWYDPEPLAAPYFERELPHLSSQPQSSGDLGERLADAFARSFADGAERVAVIGSDSPTLPDNILSAVFDDLHETDTVLGPSVDGGYYLIALRTQAWPRARALFDDIRWSGSEVFRRTAARIDELGLSVRVLPGWYDIDTIDDLRQAQQDVVADSNLARWFARPEISQYLNA